MPMPMTLNPIPRAAVVLFTTLVGPAPAGCWADTSPTSPRVRTRAAAITIRFRMAISSFQVGCGKFASVRLVAAGYRPRPSVWRVLGQPDEDRGQEREHERL